LYLKKQRKSNEKKKKKLLSGIQIESGFAIVQDIDWTKQ